MTNEEILQAVADGTLAVSDAAVLMKANSPAKTGVLSCKVSAKGAISVYGLQRMPVTLYAEQWERLLAFGDTIRTCASNNAAALECKGDSIAVKAEKAKHPLRQAAGAKSEQSPV